MVKNTLTIDCLLQAAQEWFRRQASLEAKQATYEGYSFDYHFGAEIDERDRWAEEFGKRLEAYVDQRIKAAIQNQGEPE